MAQLTAANWFYRLKIVVRSGVRGGGLTLRRRWRDFSGLAIKGRGATAAPRADRGL
jgi:hypothetical protein